MPLEDNDIPDPISSVGKRDWRIWLGLALTFFWLSAWLLVAWYFGWNTFWNQELDRLGGFEGLFAPLAFLWLVIGLFIQQKELSINTQTLVMSNRQIEEQTRVLEATELRARQASFLAIADNVFRGAGTLLGYMVSTSLGPPGKKLFSEEELKEHWSAHGSGEFERFPFLILREDLQHTGLFFENDANTAWSTELVRSFHSLLNLAYECDGGDRTISRSITQSSLAYVYSAILQQLEGSSVWAMFEDLNIFTVVGEPVDVSGHWEPPSGTEGEQKRISMELEMFDGNRVKGVMRSHIGEAPIEYGIVHGKFLFIRFTVMDSPWIFTAEVIDDRIRGKLQWREGLLVEGVSIRAPI